MAKARIYSQSCFRASGEGKGLGPLGPLGPLPMGTEFFEHASLTTPAPMGTHWVPMGACGHSSESMDAHGYP